jgi:hypothetical protein
VLRLTSILRHEGYLPYDKSGDWLYHVVETLSLLCAGVATACVAVRFSSSYNAKDDAFGNFHIPSEVPSRPRQRHPSSVGHASRSDDAAATKQR